MAEAEEITIGIDLDASGVESEADRVERSLDDVGDAAQQAGRDVESSADRIERSLGDVETAAQDAGDAIQTNADRAEQGMTDLGSTAGVAGAAAGGLFAAGLASAMDISSATAAIDDQLNLSEQDAARAGQVAGDVYAAGWGGSMEEVSQAIASVGSSVGDVADMTNAELAGMSEAALALAQRFDMDIGEASTAAGQLIRNNLVKDGKEAFDLLTAAATAFPRSMVADIPATISEYGEQFQRLGLSGSQAFGLMSQFVKAGGKDIDQAADVIHEFARITSEDTEAASEAFKALKLDSGDMLARIHEGGPKATSALGDTLEALRNVEDPAKRAQLAVALFGDMAGESADALFAMDPATAAASAGLSDVSGASQKLRDGMEGTPAQQLNSALRTLQTTLGEILLPVLTSVAGFLARNRELLKTIAPFVLGLAIAIGILVVATQLWALSVAVAEAATGAWAAVQWVLNSALFASPITWIVLAIIALVAVIVLIATKTKWFQIAWEVAWGAIKSAAQAVGNWFTGTLWPLLKSVWQDIKSAAQAVGSWFANTLWPMIRGAWNRIAGAALALLAKLRGVWNNIASGVRAMWLKIKGWWNSLVSFVRGIPGRIGRAVSGMWNGIVSGFRGAVNRVIGLWNNLSFTIGGGSILGVDIPSFTLSTPNIPYLAEGGIVTGPTLAMVGERGDEAVIPLDRLGSMTGGGGGAGPMVIQLNIGGRAFGELVVDASRRVVRTRGGDVQAVVGQRRKGA